jgi:hypothetical protein
VSRDHQCPAGLDRTFITTRPGGQCLVTLAGDAPEIYPKNIPRKYTPEIYLGNIPRGYVSQTWKYDISSPEISYLQVVCLGSPSHVNEYISGRQHGNIH